MAMPMPLGAHLTTLCPHQKDHTLDRPSPRKKLCWSPEWCFSPHNFPWESGEGGGCQQSTGNSTRGDLTGQEWALPLQQRVRLNNRTPVRLLIRPSHVFTVLFTFSPPPTPSRPELRPAPPGIAPPLARSRRVCVVLDFSVGMEAFDELLSINVPWLKLKL